MQIQQLDLPGPFTVLINDKMSGEKKKGEMVMDFTKQFTESINIAIV